MMVERLNTPNEDRATGLTAPLIRAASHLGYILGYLDEMTDEGWEAQRDSTFQDMGRELNEAIAHLRDSVGNADNPYVGQQMTELMAALRVSLDGMRATAPESKADLIRDLQNINHNIAHVGARMDRDTAGIHTAHEGLMT